MKKVSVSGFVAHRCQLHCSRDPRGNWAAPELLRLALSLAGSCQTTAANSCVEMSGTTSKTSIKKLKQWLQERDLSTFRVEIRDSLRSWCEQGVLQIQFSGNQDLLGSPVLCSAGRFYQRAAVHLLRWSRVFREFSSLFWPVSLHFVSSWSLTDFTSGFWVQYSCVCYSTRSGVVWLYLMFVCI